MTYPETTRYLESFINYEKIPAYPYKESLKLERIKNFLAAIDNPQNTLKCIHIAGTKGKGSTCAFVAYILRAAGYKVGLYTSPHLSDFRERIRVLNRKPEVSLRLCSGRVNQKPQKDFEGMISKNELTGLVEKLKPAIEKYNKNSKYGPLSFFEVYTTLAFIYFKEKKVDFAVLETGLGGRLDATNVVQPLVAAITPISYEHTQKLGNTLREIATEKAGIIKTPNLTVISAPQEEEAAQVIRNRCKEAGVRLYEVGTDIKYQKAEDKFSVKGIFDEYPDLKIRLLGSYQLVNATVAVGIVEALKFYDFDVDIAAIRQGLYNTLWPGRCEVIHKDPLVVLDGAQNIASSGVLKQAIRENFSAKDARLPPAYRTGEDGQGYACGGKYKKLILVLGISSDKDLKGICAQLYGLADEIVLTKANNPRATPPEILAEYFNGKKVYVTNNVKEAREKTKDIAKKKDLILVTGSLFVVGEFRNA